MIGSRKPYDRVLAAKAKPAEIAVCRFLRRLGLKVILHPKMKDTPLEEKDADMVNWWDGAAFSSLAEVEWSDRWKYDTRHPHIFVPFPYLSVSILERKEYWTDKDDRDIDYFCVRTDCRFAGFIWNARIRAYPKLFKVPPCKANEYREDELKREVPANEFMWFDLEELTPALPSSLMLNGHRHPLLAKMDELRGNRRKINC